MLSFGAKAPCQRPMKIVCSSMSLNALVWSSAFWPTNSRIWWILLSGMTGFCLSHTICSHLPLLLEPWFLGLRNTILLSTLVSRYVHANVLFWNRKMSDEITNAKCNTGSFHCYFVFVGKFWWYSWCERSRRSFAVDKGNLGWCICSGFYHLPRLDVVSCQLLFH